MWDMLKKKKNPFGGGDSEPEDLAPLDAPTSKDALAAIDQALEDSKRAQEARAAQERAQAEQQRKKELAAVAAAAKSRCGCW